MVNWAVNLMSAFDPKRTFNRKCGAAGGHRKPVITVHSSSKGTGLRTDLIGIDSVYAAEAVLAFTCGATMRSLGKRTVTVLPTPSSL